MTLVLSLLTAAPVGAQWLNYPTPDLPRTADGKPNLAAAAPRMADGKPDLSGLWRMDGLGHVFNILGNQSIGAEVAEVALGELGGPPEIVDWL